MPDRRIKRTKTNIYTALVSLLFERDIRNITVKELCEKADVNKSTFYLHFMDIYDCKEKWQNEMFDEILSKVDDFSLDKVVHAPEVYIRSVVTYFQENLDFYQKLASSPLAPEFSYNLKNKLSEKIIASNNLSTTDNQWEITMVAFIMGGIMDSCLINISDFDTERLITLLNQLSDSIAAYIKTHDKPNEKR